MHKCPCTTVILYEISPYIIFLYNICCTTLSCATLSSTTVRFKHVPVQHVRVQYFPVQHSPCIPDIGSGWSGGGGGWVGMLPAISNSKPLAALIHPGFRYVRKIEFRFCDVRKTEFSVLRCTKNGVSVFDVREKRNSVFLCVRKTEFQCSMCAPKRKSGFHRARQIDFHFFVVSRHGMFETWKCM